MNKKLGWLAVLALLLSSLACSMSDIGNVADVGISVCSYKNGKKTVSCQSAKADVEGKAETKFNVGDSKTPAGITSAAVRFTLTVAGQGEAKISVKASNGQVASVNATQAQPGSLSTDVQLTRETVRSATEAARTGMDTENVYFIVTVEALGGKKAEGVQVTAEVNGVK